MQSGATLSIYLPLLQTVYTGNLDEGTNPTMSSTTLGVILLAVETK